MDKRSHGKYYMGSKARARELIEYGFCFVENASGDNAFQVTREIRRFHARASNMNEIRNRPKFVFTLEDGSSLIWRCSFAAGFAELDVLGTLWDI